MIHFLWKIVFDAMSLFVSVYVRNFSFQNDGLHYMKKKSMNKIMLTRERNTNV